MFPVIVIAYYTKQLANTYFNGLLDTCMLIKPFVGAFVKLRSAAVSNVFDLSRWVLLRGFYGWRYFVV
jgi:hypothetical protein